MRGVAADDSVYPAPARDAGEARGGEGPMAGHCALGGCKGSVSVVHGAAFWLPAGHSHGYR